MPVRPETPADHDAVRALVTEVMGAPEAELVDRIRASEHHLPELALVAEEAGAVVGHVLFSAIAIEGASAPLVLALAPLCVAAERQRQGIGTALVRAGLEGADRRGAALVTVLGHPAYYRRFGFEPARPHGVLPPWDDVPDDVWMVRLPPGGDAGHPRGRVVYPPAFDAVSP